MFTFYLNYLSDFSNVNICFSGPGKTLPCSKSSVKENVRFAFFPPFKYSIFFPAKMFTTLNLLFGDEGMLRPSVFLTAIYILLRTVEIGFYTLESAIHQIVV